MRALFPSGSVTGAPKRTTLEIIRDLEATARSLQAPLDFLLRAVMRVSVCHPHT